MTPHIPKVIHYCWFGGNPLPPMAKKCIASWKKFFPDYEIKQWDESNFDINCIPYVKEAYSKKKYAFVSDYARIKILYEYGGIYFDTDVEVVKSFNDILSVGAFMGCQSRYVPYQSPMKLDVNPGLGIAAPPRHEFYKELLQLYKPLHFINKDGSLNQTTIVHHTTSLLIKKGLDNTPEIQRIAGINIYPWDYFCPLSPTLIMDMTPNTHSIHLFSATWESKTVRLRKRIKRLLGYRVVGWLQPIILKLRKK